MDADNRRTLGGDISIIIPCVESGVDVVIFSPGIKTVLNLKIIITSVEAGVDSGVFLQRKHILPKIFDMALRTEQIISYQQLCCENNSEQIQQLFLKVAFLA